MRTIGALEMSGTRLLQAVVDTCQEIVRDASSGMLVCTRYEDASVVVWMQEQQMLGVRRLIIPLVEQLGLTGMAESIIEHNLGRLDQLRVNSRCLLRVTHDSDASTSGSATKSPL